MNRVNVKASTGTIINVLVAVSIIILVVLIFTSTDKVQIIGYVAIAVMFFIVSRLIESNKANISDPAMLHKNAVWSELGTQLELKLLKNIPSETIEYDSLKDPNVEGYSDLIHIFYFKQPLGWYDTLVLRPIKNEKETSILGWYPQTVEIRSLGALRTNIRNNYFRQGVSGALSVLAKSHITGDAIKSMVDKQRNPVATTTAQK